MEEKRMFAAVKIQPNKKLNWLYAFLLPFIVQLVLDIGFIVAAVLLHMAQTFLPTDVIGLVDPLVLQLLVFALPFVMILLWVRFVERRPVAGLGLYKEGMVKELSKGLVVGVVLISAVVLSQWLTGAIELTKTHFSLWNLLYLFLVFPFWFLQSATEELSTRGWLFPSVARRTSLPLGLAASSLLFALLHLGNDGIGLIPLLNIALFGFFACLYVLQTDNIWGISAIHATWNCFQGTVFGVNVSGIPISSSLMRFSPTSAPTYLSGGVFGAEGSIFASVILSIACAYLAWKLYKNRVS